MRDAERIVSGNDEKNQLFNYLIIMTTLKRSEATAAHYQICSKMMCSNKNQRRVVRTHAGNCTNDPNRSD
ncbi:hypothetical protein Y032_0023g848 [Ancylostoma ceylanicum]|uniref:Uncharacterized protein n=1 Tax=Ancylostoma ceylanicum TaxID=53326 RepID=A0A016V034_9BILA|nr:hypothetical protein Y032_0023g848 [Ancylostoma ceylanicum]